MTLTLVLLQSLGELVDRWGDLDTLVQDGTLNEGRSQSRTGHNFHYRRRRRRKVEKNNKIAAIRCKLENARLPGAGGAHSGAT